MAPAAAPEEAPQESVLRDAGAIRPPEVVVVPAEDPTEEEPDPWWVATVTADPEGTLAAFWWTVPEGVPTGGGLEDIPEAEGMESADSGQEPMPMLIVDLGLSLEVLPLVPAEKASAITTWGLVTFEENDEGLLEASSGSLETTVEIREFTGATEKDPVILTPSLETTSFTIFEELVPGDRIPFVLFAQSTESVELVVAFHVAKSSGPGGASWNLEGDAKPLAPGNLSDLRDDPRIHLFAPEVVHAKGFAFGAYEEFVWSPPPPELPQGGDARIGDVALLVDEGRPLRGVGGYRKLEVALETPFEKGWSVVEGQFLGWGAGASRWWAELDAFGQTSSEQGAGPEAHPAQEADQNVRVSASASAQGCGEGRVSLRFGAERATALTGSLRWSVVRVAFGATLEDLFGIAAAAETWVLGEPSLPAAGAAPWSWLRTGGLGTRA